MRALLLVAVLACACATSPLVERKDEIMQRASRYDVEILRDTYGVPHIYGKRDRDAVFGLAYAHAEDDFRTIEDVIAATRGVLAKKKGADAAVTDYLVALLDVWPTVESKWTEIPEDVRAIADAYADGINKYAAEHPREVEIPWVYPVRGHDVVAGFVFKTPLFFGLDRQLKALFALEETPQKEIYKGSNGIAVAPARSGDETTRLYVNSHQPWAGPVTWYEAHLVSEEGMNSYGGTFPGAPVILHGFNQDLGWAFTVNRPDLIDVFLLELNDDGQYRMGDKWLDLEREDVTLEVNVLGFTLPVTREILRSVHGPVLETDHGTFAIRYANMGEVQQLTQWVRMNRSRSFDEWREAMRMQAIPSFNAVYADREGHIAYFYNAALPVRAHEDQVDYQGILDGADPRLIWRATHPFDALPQVVDPEGGVVFNANHKPFLSTSNPEENPKQNAHPPSVETTMTNRGHRLVALFKDRAPIDRARLMKVKHDVTYAPASTFAQIREQVLALEGFEKEKAVLRAWDLSATKDNRSAALGILTAIPHYFASYEPSLNPKLEESLKSASARLKAHFGRLDPTWGEVNRLRRGALDLPLAGGPDTLRAVTAFSEADDGRHVGEMGDSLIILVEWGPNGLRAQSVHQYGSATLDEESPHYSDQARLFADEKYKDVWFTRAAVEANLERRYRP